MEPLVEVVHRERPGGGPALVLRITVPLILDLFQTSELKRALVEGLGEDEACPFTVIDLRELRHANTQLLAILISVQKRLTESGRTLRICNVDPEVAESIRLCMLHKIFEIVPTLDDALA